MSRIQSLRQHQELDVQDQQEGRVVDRTHVERVSRAENHEILPDHLLADGSQGAVLYQCPCRTDGHGRTMETTNLIRSGLCHFRVSRSLLSRSFFFRVRCHLNSNLNSLHSIESDGRGRAGVYCAANVAIEQVVQHGEVDVFQAVKTVRRHRPQLVENMVTIGTLFSYAVRCSLPACRDCLDNRCVTN
jgi:hypothetical protein